MPHHNLINPRVRGSSPPRPLPCGPPLPDLDAVISTPITLILALRNDVIPQGHDLIIEGLHATDF